VWVFTLMLPTLGGSPNNFAPSLTYTVAVGCYARPRRHPTHAGRRGTRYSGPCGREGERDVGGPGATRRPALKGGQGRLAHLDRWPRELPVERGGGYGTHTAEEAMPGSVLIPAPVKATVRSHLTIHRAIGSICCYDFFFLHFERIELHARGASGDSGVSDHPYRLG